MDCRWGGSSFARVCLSSTNDLLCFVAVNVNIWLSLDGANLDQDSGGLVVYTTKPPGEWDMQ